MMMNTSNYCETKRNEHICMEQTHIGIEMECVELKCNGSSHGERQTGDELWIWWFERMYILLYTKPHIFISWINYESSNWTKTKLLLPFAYFNLEGNEFQRHTEIECGSSFECMNCDCFVCNFREFSRFRIARQTNVATRSEERIVALAKLVIDNTQQSHGMFQESLNED